MRLYDCELCGMTFPAGHRGPLPRWCSEDRPEGTRLALLARQTGPRPGAVIPVHQALALTVVEQRLAITVATFALTTAAMCRRLGRDDRPYLDAALDSLERVRPVAARLIPTQRVGS